MQTTDWEKNKNRKKKLSSKHLYASVSIRFDWYCCSFNWICFNSHLASCICCGFEINSKHNFWTSFVWMSSLKGQMIPCLSAPFRVIIHRTHQFPSPTWTRRRFLSGRSTFNIRRFESSRYPEGEIWQISVNIPRLKSMIFDLQYLHRKSSKFPAEHLLRKIIYYLFWIFCCFSNSG